MSRVRRCSRTACQQVAVASLTYVYAESTAVVGPLATRAEPHCYDLCEAHAERLTAPKGWELVRLEIDQELARQRSQDDLEALANLVREAGRARPTAAAPLPGTEIGRRGHLRVLRTPGA